MSEFDTPPVTTPPAMTPPPATPPSMTEPAKDGSLSIISTIALLVLAPVIALFLTAFVFQSYEVDGPSMQSTLQNHDRLIVLKVPRTLSRLTHHAFIPQRGEIIVFNHAEAFGLGNSQKQLIKRVVGLPGERVVVKDNVLTVYNKANPNGFSPDKTMAYGKVIGDTPGDVDLTVPAGEVFVCGDNRSNSLDSRYFGTVAANDIVGRLSLRVYPFSTAERFN